jgi:hypothetical protein
LRANVVHLPAALVFLDFLWRPSGVRQQDDRIEWNICPPASQGRSSFVAKIGTVTAELIYDGPHAELRLAGRLIAQASGTVRLLTMPSGELRTAIGISENESVIALQVQGRPKRTLRIGPNQRLDLRATQSPGSGVSQTLYWLQQ